MENNVVTLDTAKKLKAAGFPQNKEHTQFAWRYRRYPEGEITSELGGLHHEDNEYALCAAAPTAQEIADQLAHFRVHKLKDGLFTSDNGKKSAPTTLTLAEALAELWLKLRDTGADHE